MQKRNKHIKLLINLCIGLLVSTTLSAQKFTVTAKVDSSVIWIGDQTGFTLEVSQPIGQKVNFPLFSDTLIHGLEIVEPLKIDTVAGDNNSIRVLHKYIITAFKDTLYYIPSYPFVEGTDTVWSNSVSLKVVQPFQIDTASNSITDIKPVFQPKYDWSGLFKKILLTLLVLAVLAVAYYFIRKKIQKKPVVLIHKEEPAIPPHEAALHALDKIKEEKLWMKGKYKEYHTQLTDVIREYIERRFRMNSMEMTSSEILDNLPKNIYKEQKTAFSALHQLLQLADLVKFAKWVPSPEENISSLNNAYLFVEQTKEETPLTEEKQTEKPVDKKEGED
jgi:uncharacterized protein (UPF0333 family)